MMRIIQACLTVFAGVFVANVPTMVLAQSGLLGDTYAVSLQNSPINVGTTIDPETQAPTDHGSAAFEVTFDGVDEDFGRVRIGERVSVWEGKPGGIPAIQNSGIDGETAFDLLDWENSGEIVEFSFGTNDGSYVSDDDEGQGLMTIRGLDWAGALPGTVPEFYENSWYIYYTMGGVAVTGMEVQIPELGILVGAHPYDPSISEVMYIAYGRGQVDDIAEPFGGGTDLYFGTTQLDPVNGSWELLANAFGFSAIKFFNQVADVDAVHIGTLIKPPTPASISLLGDFNNDQVLTGADVDLLTAGIGGSDLRFDLNQDGVVSLVDRSALILDVAQTFFGDADLDGSVQFPDFLVLSANFGQLGGWGQGDFDGDGDVAFSDFLLLSSNFGQVRQVGATNAVPEPASEFLVLWSLTGLLARRRRR